MKPALIKQKLNSQLDQLNARERMLVTYGGALAGVLITWFVFIEPAWQTVQQAPGAQAALVDKAGQVMRAAQDLEALRGARSRVVVPDTDLQQRLEALLIEQGIAERSTLIRTEEGDIRVEFAQVSASGFLAWLVRAEAISSLKANVGEIEKGQAGELSGYLSFVPLNPAQGNPR